MWTATQAADRAKSIAKKCGGIAARVAPVKRTSKQEGDATAAATADPKTLSRRPPDELAPLLGLYRVALNTS